MGRSSCPESDRAKLVPCGTGFAPHYQAREGIWTGKEPLLPRLAKHSDPIAKHIIIVSSYSRYTGYEPAVSSELVSGFLLFFYWL